MNHLSNSEISDLYDELVFAYQILGEPDYKTSIYKNASFLLKNAPFEVATATPEEIQKIKGIGKTISHQITTMIQSGTFPELEEAYAQIPQEVLEMRQIKGLGPKKISALWHEHGIDSVPKLQQAINNGSLANIKGFGTKTIESLQTNLNWLESVKGYHLYAEVVRQAESLMGMLKDEFTAYKFYPVGTYARQCDVIDKVQFITDLPITEIKQRILFLDIISGIDSNIVYFEIDGIPIELSCISGEIIEYDRFRLSCDTEYFDHLYVDKDHFQSDELVYEEKGMPFVPVIQRESAYIFDVRPQVEDLVSIGDIKGLIHCHSHYSDGSYTIEELAQQCITDGLEYMVISDHSQSAFYANGLTPDRIIKQHQEVDRLNSILKPFRIFKSIECDILIDGSLDYPDEILSSFDIIIASVHSKLDMDIEEATNRVVRAIANPYVRILGHPTGRLLLKRPGYELNIRTLVHACKEHSCALEINANPRRLDIDWSWVPYVLSEGVKVSINPDAHTLKGIQDIEYGVISARKGGVKAKDNISSLSREEFSNYFKINK